MPSYIGYELIQVEYLPSSVIEQLMLTNMHFGLQ